MLKDFSSGDFAKILNDLKSMTTITFEDAQNYSELVKSMSEEQRSKFNRKLIQFLNYFEGIAISIKNEIVDEEICYDYAVLIYQEYYKIFNSYIKDKRVKDNMPQLYLDFEMIATRWAERLEQENLDSTSKTT